MTSFLRHHLVRPAARTLLLPHAVERLLLREPVTLDPLRVLRLALRLLARALA